MTALLASTSKLSSRPVEAVLGLLTALLSMWMVAFQWFSSYLPSLKDFAGMEWMIGVPMMVYGICQVASAVGNYRAPRFFFAMFSFLIYFLFTSAAVYDNGWMGPHVPGFGLCIACHLWAWFKITGLWPGADD